jgi:Putative Ig domain
MRRLVTVLVSGTILGLIGVGVPAAASATTSGDLPQPPAPVVGQAYSYQLQDVTHGAVTSASLSSGFAPCTTASYAPGLPVGLSMTSTGLIAGTPTLPEQTQFCVGLFFADGSNESVVVAMTVGTGNATLDPIVMPVGTQLHSALQNESVQVLEPIVGQLLQAPGCIEYLVGPLLGGPPDAGPPPQYCL